MEQVKHRKERSDNYVAKLVTPSDPKLKPFVVYSRKAKFGTPSKIYALYHGDEFLDIGNKYELGTKYNLAPTSIAYMGTPAGKAQFIKGGSKGFTVVRFEEGWEDDEQ